MRVLIADDDRVLVHLLSSRLRAKGFDVVAAFDAMQAWMAVMKSGVDAVILDIQMPGGTGIEVLRKLKDFPKTSLVPVIVVSGSISSEQIQLVKSLGADEFLPKPPDVDRLYESLCELLHIRAGVGGTENRASERSR